MPRPKRNETDEQTLHTHENGCHVPLFSPADATAFEEPTNQGSKTQTRSSPKKIGARIQVRADQEPIATPARWTISNSQSAERAGDPEILYRWVLARVADGKLYDRRTRQPTLISCTELANDPSLRPLLGRIFYCQFSKAIAAAHPSVAGESLQARTTSAYRNLVGENPQAGRNVLDDWDMLVDMFDRANKGIAIELLRSVDAWQSLEPPDEVDLAPIARKVFHAASSTGGFFRPRAQSESSTVRRLVDKYRKNYRYLAADYIVGEELRAEAARLMTEVAILIRRRGFPIDRDAAW